MDLTTDEVRLIRETHELINLISKTVAKQIYQRLFALDPALRAHFPADLTLQQIRLMATLQLLVETLDQSENFSSAAHRLATEHAGLSADALTLLSQAILSTIPVALGRACTPAVYAAWQKTCDAVLTEITIDALESI